MRSLVWYRNKDLRVSDHEPLSAAARGGEAIPVYVWNPIHLNRDTARRRPHSTQFLLDSLSALAGNLAALGSGLHVVKGDPVEVIPELADRFKVDRVVAHRLVEPSARAETEQVSRRLETRLQLFEGETLHPPQAVLNQSGNPFAVFSHFARALGAALMVAGPSRAPTLTPLPCLPELSGTVLPSMAELGLTRNFKIIRGGERAARRRLSRFLEEHLTSYDTDRDVPGVDKTSRLSADLRFGTLSARQVWGAVKKVEEVSEGTSVFLRQLIWREFAYYSLFHRPLLTQTTFRPEFQGFPWSTDRQSLEWRAWCTGATGYPLVDAAARQLLAEGFVHNRARMVSASFLTKHLMIDYRHGEAHYLDLLVDGDVAQNNLGWQWSAGCGCDAQPYFRVFNPVLQGKRFDPEGRYVRRWIPEISKLPDRFIHQPWRAPPAALQAAGVRLGTTYPSPVVEHVWARARFLDAAGRHLRGYRFSEARS